MLKLIQKYFNRKILLSYDPGVLWRYHLSHRVEILYFKNVTSAKLKTLFLKSTIRYLPNDGSIVLIAHVVQNLWAFLFSQNLLNLWRHFTRNLDVIAKMIKRNQILIWYCVLRNTYTNFSIRNQLCYEFYGRESNEPPHLLLSK